MNDQVDHGPLDSSEIEEVLHALLGSTEFDAGKVYEGFRQNSVLQSAVQDIRRGDVKAVYFKVLRPVEQLIGGMVREEFAHDVSGELSFLVRHCNWITNMVRHLFEHVEGSACCADKARTVVAAIAMHLVNEREIRFDYTQEYTFHLPAKVLKSQQDVMSYFRALRSLSLGNPGPYIRCLDSLFQAPASVGDVTG